MADRHADANAYRYAGAHPHDGSADSHCDAVAVRHHGSPLSG